MTSAIPVVVVSADATAGQVERLRAAGAIDFVAKPIDVKSLRDIVTRSTLGAARGG